jgi:anti-sigma B factor antagonist
VKVDTADYKRSSLVTVSGRVDSNTAPQLEEALQKIVEKGQYNIALDMSDVEFLSSAGLRVMVSVLKRCRDRGGNLLIADPSDRVTQVLQLAGLTDLFTVYDDVTAAVGSF